MKKFPLFFLLIACKPSVKTTNYHCTQKIAEAIADDFMKKRRNVLSEFNRTIIDGGDTFTIEYLIKDSTTLGGGGLFKISKKNCTIVEKKLYQ